MVGAFATGKTSLVSRFVKSIYSDTYQTTVGVKIDKKLVNIQGQEVSLIIWDIHGEDAWRHTPPNTVVTVNLQLQTKYILFTVDDEGSGVSPELAARLFQKFTQGKQNTGRSGLGLYFCRTT
jgi:GTPase SAR1 family protein